MSYTSGTVRIVPQDGKPEPKHAAFRKCDGHWYSKEELAEMEDNPDPNLAVGKQMVKGLAAVLAPEESGVDAWGIPTSRERKRRKAKIAYDTNMVVAGDLT